jgi:hypothetical protein
LTRAVLDEIPDQLVTYFDLHGIAPLPPVRGSQINLMAAESDEHDIDLSMDIRDDGAIHLTNYDGAIYDDTKYDTWNNYSDLTPLAPSAPLSASVPQSVHSNRPSAPTAYYSASLPTHTVQSNVPSAPTSNYSSSVNTNQYNSASQFHSQPTAPTVPHSTTPYFLVQVPPGVTPGSQLQVTNPKTGQQMIVTVPKGIPAGGTFGVEY